MPKLKVLISSDNFTHPSGVGNQARAIIYQLLNDNFDVVQAAIISASPDNCPPPTIYKTQCGDVKVVSLGRINETVNFNLFVHLFEAEKPDAVILFQDPKYFVPAFNSVINLVRQKCPVIFVHVWDTHLVGDMRHFNRWMYESCDHISCISHQTRWFVEQVLKDTDPQIKPTLSYVGHGQDPENYKPLKLEEYATTKSELFKGKDYNFVVLMNNRNQLRKKQADLIYAWRLFNESLPPEEADKCCLVLHTELMSLVGTDLKNVADNFAGQSNIVFSVQKLPEVQLNHIVNCADVIVNLSNAAGFELNINEGMLAGKPIIANSTGGLIDQIGYQDDAGHPLTFNLNLKNNLENTRHGCWSYPLPNQKTITGSVPTPFLWDENAAIEDVVKGLQYWYSIPKEERQARGLQGRQWCFDRGLNCFDFSKAVVRDVNQTIQNFKPAQMFSIYPI